MASRLEFGIAFCGGALALLVACAGCEKPQPPQARGATQQRETIQVAVAPVRVEAVDRTVDIVGSLYGDEQATMSAKVPGRIQQVLVDVGDRVSAGQELLRIDPTDYELAVRQRQTSLLEALAKLGLTQLPSDDFDVTTIATVERARFQAANAKAKLERARQLFERQPPLISEQDFADLETAYEVAMRDRDVAELEAKAQLALARTRASELQSAEQRLADTIVRAPGIPGSTTQPAALSFGVTLRRVSAGEYVREGDPLVDLVIDDPIRFRASVPERYLADVKTGQRGLVRVESYAEPFEATVRRINPAIDQQSRAFQVELEVPNPRRLLRPGAFARGVVIVGQDPNITFVPKDAVVTFAGTSRVFTVAEGKAVEHIIETGVERDGWIALISGFEGGDSVIVTGNERLSAGAPVAVSEHPTTAPQPPQ